MDIGLLAIDIQIGFRDRSWGMRNNPDAESRMAEVLALFRKIGWPIFHVQHRSEMPDSPLRPDRPGVEFMDFAKPLGREPVIQKNVNSAFIGTSLGALLSRIHDAALARQSA